MNITPELNAYLKRCRELSVPDDAIRSNLLAKGWQTEIINQLLNAEKQSEASPRAPITQFSQGKSQSKRQPLNKLFVAIAIAIVILLSVIAAVILTQRPGQIKSNNQAISLQVNDSNYSLTLPNSWQPATANVNGSGINTFFEGTADSQSRITVFVLPKEAEQNYKTHIDQEINGLSRNGAKVEVLATTKTNFDGNEGEIISAVASKASNPAQKTYYIFTGTTLDKVHYNIDTIIPADKWEGSQESVLKSLQSFKPKTTDLIYRKPK